MKSDNTDPDRKNKGTRGNKSPEKAEAAVRRFTQVVNAIKRFVNLFLVDRTDHVAKGLLTCKDGKARRTSLIYDDRSSLIALSVYLGRLPVMTASQAECLMRMQRQARLARFDHDSEDGELTVHSGCICPPTGNPADLLGHLVADLQRVLSDSRLAMLLNL